MFFWTVSNRIGPMFAPRTTAYAILERSVANEGIARFGRKKSRRYADDGSQATHTCCMCVSLLTDDGNVPEIRFSPKFLETQGE